LSVDVWQLIRKVGLDDVQVYDHEADNPVVGSVEFVTKQLQHLQKKFPGERYEARKIRIYDNRGVILMRVVVDEVPND
jgi:hypothetical protein